MFDLNSETEEESLVISIDPDKDYEPNYNPEELLFEEVE